MRAEAAGFVRSHTVEPQRQETRRINSLPASCALPCPSLSAALGASASFHADSDLQQLHLQEDGFSHATRGRGKSPRQRSSLTNPSPSLEVQGTALPNLPLRLHSDAQRLPVPRSSASGLFPASFPREGRPPGEVFGLRSVPFQVPGASEPGGPLPSSPNRTQIRVRFQRSISHISASACLSQPLLFLLPWGLSTEHMNPHGGQASSFLRGNHGCRSLPCKPHARE